MFPRNTAVAPVPYKRVPVDPMRLGLGQVSRRIQFGLQLLPEIEGLFSDVDDTTMFEKEIRADQSTERIPQVIRSLW